MTTKMNDERRSTYIVFAGLALLLLLAGIVKLFEIAYAEEVTGRIVKVHCYIDHPPGDKKGKHVEQCKAEVSYSVNGVEKILASRLVFNPGELKEGAEVSVNLAADPVEIVSGSHDAGWLIISFAGALVLFILARKYKKGSAEA